MGSHIDSFFRGKVAYDPEMARRKLELTFSSLSNVLDMLETYPRDVESWSAYYIEIDEVKFLTAEGPHYFSINFYENVVRLHCGQRFHKISDPVSPIAIPLRTIFCAIAQEFGDSEEILIAAGGFGDTDHADEIAFQGGSLDLVISAMNQHAGPPATSWPELESGDYSWYLGPPTI